MDNALNSSFREFSGFVPLYLHQGFIQSQLVPEPSAVALLAVCLVGLGALTRRRR